jgi:acylphosphatase
MSERIATRILIEGRVQGVGYRWWMVVEAQALGLSGWVRNRSDGRVEALAIGPPDTVALLVGACGRGPAAARVRTVNTESAADDGSGDFEQRATV